MKAILSTHDIAGNGLCYSMRQGTLIDITKLIKFLMYLNDYSPSIDGDGDVVIIAPQSESVIAGADLNIMPTIGVRSANFRLLGVYVSVCGVNLELRNARQLSPASYWVGPEQASQLTFTTGRALPAAAKLMQGQVNISTLIYDVSEDDLHVSSVRVAVLVSKPGFFSPLTLPDDDHAGHDSDRDPGSPPAGCGSAALVWSHEAREVVPSGICAPAVSS